jgi:glycosyltransferase involved in cell wall biosynthesis
MTLGLVIPVWNDQSALTRLLVQIGQMGIFDQVVVVDDGSDVPIWVPHLPGVDMRLIRVARSAGPGAARNTGAAQITTRYMMFFDSDDLMTVEMPLLWQDLQGAHFDFCLFRHTDSRQVWHGGDGLTAYDAALWRAAGMGGRALYRPGPCAVAHLAQTANYPWNKIWHTEFWRAHDIRFPDLPVHQDIAPHWAGFLYAQDILVSDRMAAVHHVAGGGGRLTNKKGSERLAVFQTLIDTHARLAAAPAHKARLLPAFVRFACDLLDWVHDNLDPGLHADLARLRRDFWRLVLPPAQFDRLASDDPALALHITLQMGEAALTC